MRKCPSGLWRWHSRAGAERPLVRGGWAWRKWLSKPRRRDPPCAAAEASPSVALRPRSSFLAKPAGYGAGAIGNAETVVGVVHPKAGPAVAAVRVAAPGIVESEIIKERVVHEQSLGQPAQRPSPASQSEQAREPRQETGQIGDGREQRSEAASRVRKIGIGAAAGAPQTKDGL